MGFTSVYKSLKELFPQIEPRILRDIAIDHPNDADEAAESVFLSEIVPFLSPNLDDNFTQPENESSENLPDCKVEPEGGSLSLSQWLNPSKVPQSYLALLNEEESSTLPPDEKKPSLNYTVEKVIPPSRGDEKNPPLDYVVKKIVLPSRGCAAAGVGEGVRNLFSPSEKTGSSSSSMVKPSIRVQSRTKDENISKVPATRRSSRKSTNQLSYHDYSERLRSWNKNKNRDLSQLDGKNRDVPWKQSNRNKQKSYNTELERKQRIDYNIKALAELLPNEAKEEDTSESILNDVIAHVKLLQLQMKELSRNRLGGEETPHPMTYIEGFGHYIHHDKMMTKSLEEEMADLLVNDFDAAASLLESKGLYLMPLSNVEGFF